jgi:hypothetical protein
MFRAMSIVDVRSQPSWMFLSLLAAVWSGCVSDADSTQGGAQGVTATDACTVTAAKDGHMLTSSELAALKDPVANLILKGQGCPMTFSDIQTTLAKTDPCGPGEDGLSTRVVSDRSMLLGAPDTYRAVVERQCQQRKPQELLMSVFGIQAHADGAGKLLDAQVPQDKVELIGEQKTVQDGKVTSGVFNFYALENKQWKFFGSSVDFLSQGYECNADGACIPKAATQQRCASCHVGGGLVMKELESPWVNWESNHSETPGATDVIARFPALFGKRETGVDLESTVEEGNRNDWIPTRVAALKKLGLKEVLRPLFCATDMNLISTTSKPTEDLFTDRVFGGALSEGDFGYAKAIADVGQEIIDGRTGKQLSGKGNIPVVDTHFGFTHPMRSGQDSNYVDELQRQNIVDIDFVKDVAHIDFTRPLYSPVRCALLDQAPDVAAEDMTAPKIKAAWVKKLDGATDAPSAQLLASLKNEGDAHEHDADVKAFLAACDARATSDTAGFMRDVLRYASHLRLAAKRARNEKNGGIIEFAETLPVDNLPESHDAFKPATCKLP